MRPWIGMSFLLCLYTAPLAAQTATYHDVAVIINTNSAVSDSVGTYFAAQRHIHPANILRITVPVTEEITTAQFADLRSQVETQLLSRGIADSINYLVTTKGVPLKVKGADLFYSASVEGELALILGPYAGLIGNNGRVASPYYRQRNHFSHRQYGIYLVTRLDGYTVADIRGLIDRAETIPEHLPADGRFVLDMDPTWNTAAPYLNSRMRIAADTLRKRGMEVLLDTTTLFIANQLGVIGYTGWGTNDKNAPQYGRVRNTWSTGAIAETYVSTSARSFVSPPVYGQSLIADIIAEGVTGVKGYVYEPYANAMADVSILFDLYTAGYTMAESYSSASQFLSWMDVVIGDPKYRFTADRLPTDGEHLDESDTLFILPVELTAFLARRSGNVVQLRWSTASETDNYGFELQRSAISTQLSFPENRELTAESREWTVIGFVAGNGASSIGHEYQFADLVTSCGMFSYRLRQIDRSGAFRYSPEVMVEASSVPSAFRLDQNHPNPFNPTTTISYQLSERGATSLRIYDALGRLVAEPVNEMKEPGTYTVRLDAAGFASGVYFYLLQSPSARAVKKMQLLK